MDTCTPHEKLVDQIQAWSGQSREAFQVAQRLRQLLPETLRAKKRFYSRSGRMAAAERQALCDADYLEAIQRCWRLRQEALQSRIQYETHLMLVHARQSLRGLQRDNKSVTRNPSKLQKR